MEKLSTIIAKNDNIHNLEDKKHLIMLYGPPASGKSRAKEIILNRLKINHDQYIDINLDDIIGDDINYQNKISTLKQNASKEDTISEDIKQEATNIYFTVRKTSNIVFEILLFITRLYNISLVVEVTGSTYCSMIWWYHILNFYKSKQYIITLIYPVVSKNNEIIRRAELRGNNIFRFISSDVIQNSINNAKKNIKIILYNKNDIFNNIYIL